MSSKGALPMELWCLIIQYAFPSHDSDGSGKNNLYTTSSSVRWLFSITEFARYMAQIRPPERTEDVRSQESWILVILKDPMFRKWKSIILAKDLTISSRKWQILIRSKANACAEDNYPILVAAERSKLEVMRCLLENKADINAKDGAPLYWACRDGRLEVVRWLLSNKANVDINGSVPIYWASREGHLEVVRCLLEYKANVRNREIASSAFANKHWKVVELLVQNGAENPRTPGTKKCCCLACTKLERR